MYTRILAPVDGSRESEQVIPYVRSLALRLSLPVTLLHAIEPETFTISQSLNPTLHFHELLPLRVMDAQEYVDPTAEGLRHFGLTVHTQIPQGEPADAIVGEAATDAGTLIAMSSHGRSGLARWWMGSVADKVLHMTDNALLVIHAVERPKAPPQTAFERIIVPVDGSELAEEIFPHAVHLSSVMGLAVDLVRVNPSRDVYSRSLPVALSRIPRFTPSYEEYIEIVDSEAEEYLAGIKERLISQGATSVDTHLMHGPAADTIADIAASTTNNLVAMSTHGRSGVGRMVLGSVAERVAHQFGSPVLLVRRKGGG